MARPFSLAACLKKERPPFRRARLGKLRGEERAFASKPLFDNTFCAAPCDRKGGANPLLWSQCSAFIGKKPRPRIGVNPTASGPKLFS
jgi:hypothetical protein